MTINLEILNAAFLLAPTQVEDLNTKALVPKMVFRRRLTRASKLTVELMDKVDFKEGRIMYGSAYGELPATANILNAILNKEGISPTDFQNSVYNTPVSYASILEKNESEILTISCGDNTSNRLLKMGAIKALDGDEILLVVTETMNIENIEQVNKCIDFLEVAVALKVKVTKEKATMDLKDDNTKCPESVKELLSYAKQFNENQKNIIEVKL